jgi:hypothetical protein
MTGRATQETGVFSWTKGAAFGGPLTVSAPFFFFPESVSYLSLPVI